MIKKVLLYVKENLLIEEGDKIIVALSGGADSVALLLSLCELKSLLKIDKIGACHINHNLRETAKRDELFAKKLCENLNIPFYLKSADIKKISKENKICEEDAGRNVRYNFFKEIRETYDYNKTATAHTKDDQVETFFMRVLRGTGTDGLTCIKPIREDNTIRPLLNITKEEIYKYLEDKGQDFVTDETNFKSDYLRNKIRLELIPYLKDKFSFSQQTVISTIDNIRKDSEFIKDELDKYNIESKNFTYDVDVLKKLPESVLLRFLRNELLKLNIKAGGKTITRLIDIININKTGKTCPINKEFMGVISYNKFYIKKKDIINKYVYQLSLGDNYIKEAGINLVVKEGAEDSKDSVNVPSLDGLYARSRKEGDKIYVKEIGGSKKLKDIFIDKKINKEFRDKIPIITYNDKIIWVVGLYKNKEDKGCYNIKMQKMESGIYEA